ncbi:MAG TPA: UDP-N-acetylmuramoyl-L-alanyl-D-glutamate--2,6-diaminopimelate ligase [Bryobacteraceae bacterium]|jgi:UDP-N-acetylmuramoyl-L-alanyl-D-glutamate--2,6-diaminopimelate ligase|nr:UDP-N-acetylmuramoyl-L-alanyl-D-glutamate--2,6-diaminopimelate ligase [Bryobacteraceae bacterium]
MTTSEVLAGVPLVSELPPSLAQTRIEGLEYDSRRVKPGYLFFAFPGSRVDGREFAGQAVANGAIAVASELTAPEGVSVPWIQVEYGRRALALASKTFYGKPDEKIPLIGITGTNGKTTTSYLIDSILRTAGKTTMLAGTIEYHLGSKILPAPNTTPESLDLHRMLAELDAMSGETKAATMEVSSHALALGRVYGLQFRTAVFTNLTQDHLDFHHTMDEYFAAKQLLFTGNGAPPPRYSVLNRDDPWAEKLGSRKLTPGNTSEVLWYGLGAGSMARARHVHSGLNGLRFDVVIDKVRFEIRSPLIGKVNVYNILAACCVGMTFQLQPEVIARGVEACSGVPGRFERVDEGQPFAVVVDYSHTDDALRNAISVARALDARRVITLFGCGGDRDRTKRPLMGRVAGELSDLVILTSDNPRSEEPLQIMNDVLVGLRRTDTRTIVEPDRAAAIRKSIEEAHEGDIVILAGKGHETYQIFRDRTIHFDDREVAREALRAFGFDKNNQRGGGTVQ